MSFPTFKQLPLQTQITVILGLLLIAASAFVAKKPFWGILSLALTYFLTRLRNIIGAVLFHGPVRDGKGWFRDAMGTRRNWLCRC